MRLPNGLAEEDRGGVGPRPDGNNGGSSLRGRSEDGAVIPSAVGRGDALATTGGPAGSGEAHAADLQTLRDELAVEPGLTLRQLKAKLSVPVAESTVCRTLQKLGLTLKKVVDRRRTRPVRRRRAAEKNFAIARRFVPPDSLVFLNKPRRKGPEQPDPARGPQPPGSTLRRPPALGPSENHHVAQRDPPGRDD